jgi:hypothetical protein
VTACAPKQSQSICLGNVNAHAWIVGISSRRAPFIFLLQESSKRSFRECVPTTSFVFKNPVLVNKSSNQYGYLRLHMRNVLKVDFFKILFLKINFLITCDIWKRKNIHFTMIVMNARARAYIYGHSYL